MRGPTSGAPLSSEGQRLRRLVKEDLRELEVLYERDDSVEGAVRHGSVLLRRLLTDGGDIISRLRRCAGASGEPRVEAVDLARVYPRGASTGVDYVVAGGGDYRAAGAVIQTRGLQVGSSVLPPPLPWPDPAALTLSKFLDSVCVIVGERRIKRRELINYMANKLGGVHYDDRRNPQTEAAFIALDSLGHRPTHPDELSFLIGGGDSVDDGLHPVFFEVLSIGQALVRSADVRALAGLPPRDR